MWCSFARGCGRSGGVPAGLPADVPILPVGVCSNMIVRDGGIRGVVIRMGRGFNEVEIDGMRVRAGSAALDAQVAKKAAEAGVDLTFLRTIPGAIGGAVKMNAGCYGSYVADVLIEVEVVLRDGSRRILANADLEFGYRMSALPDGAIVLSALLEGTPGDPGCVRRADENAEQLARRADSQPVDDLSCGSTFRNPAGFSSTGREDDVHDLKAWKVIDDAGCRGLTAGWGDHEPEASELSGQFRGATSADLEGLGEGVRKRVLAHSGIALEWEIMRIGEHSPAAWRRPRINRGDQQSP